MILKVNIIKIHTEHCYISNPIMECSELFESIKNQVINAEEMGFIPSFYHNHYVLECDNGLMIGVNDNTIKIGFEIGKLEDSKTLTCTNFRLISRFRTSTQ